MRKTPVLPILAHCYSFLRGGMPIVLGVTIQGHGRHAVTLAGYELADDHEKTNELETIGLQEPRLRGSRISRFYVHDDQIQPFAQIDVKHSAASSLIYFETDWPSDANGLGPARAKADPFVVITPLYHKIRVSPTSLMPHLAELRTFLADLPAEFAAKDDVEFDLYIAKSNEYKAELAVSTTALKRKEALTQPLPRFVWRARCDHRGTPLFELLADTTDVDQSFQFIAMTFHRAEFAGKLRAHLEADRTLLRRLIPPMQRLLLDALEGA